MDEDGIEKEKNIIKNDLIYEVKYKNGKKC